MQRMCYEDGIITDILVSKLIFASTLILIVKIDIDFKKTNLSAMNMVIRSRLLE